MLLELEPYGIGKYLSVERMNTISINLQPRNIDGSMFKEK